MPGALLCTHTKGSTMKKKVIRAILGVGIFCSALGAQSLLSRAAALPSSPGCGLGSKAGLLCQIDSNGCEVWQGFDPINRCNTGGNTDGTFMQVMHEVLPIPNDGQPHPFGGFVGNGSVGNSAYATLFCSTNGQQELYRGVIHPNDVHNCPTGFAFLSMCGSSTACSQYTQ